MSVTLILGPMHSGKTTELLDTASRLNAMDLKCLYINSSIDVRTTTEISTHNPIITYKDKLPNITFIKVSRLEGLDVSDFYAVLIDEGQFHHNLQDNVVKFIEAGKHVHVSALVGDYNCKPFGEVLSLIPLVDNPATNVRFKSSYCSRCKQEKGLLSIASFSYRLNREEREQISVSRMYEPLCAQHYHNYSSQ